MEHRLGEWWGTFAFVISPRKNRAKRYIAFETRTNRVPPFVPIPISPAPPADYFSFIKGFRGSRKLKVGAFTFTKNKIAMSRTYWSCARAGLHKCKARVVTVTKEDHQQVFIKNNEHNHDPF